MSLLKETNEMKNVCKQMPGLCQKSRRCKSEATGAQFLTLQTWITGSFMPGLC